MRMLAIFLFLAATLQAQVSLEAEDATLNGTTVGTDISGYSGTGFVYLAGSGSITFNVNVAQKGFYKLVIRANTSLGNKNQKLNVNGVFVNSLNFPARSDWFDYDAGSVVLKAGANNVQILPDWGYMYFDKITLTQTPPHDYSKVAAKPIDPLVDSATNALYQYLRSQFGKNMLAGQTDYWNELVQIAGKTPAVRCFDMQNYSGHNPWDNNWNSTDDGTVQKAINWHKSTGGKGIVSFHWHWFSPMGGTLRTSTFYTDQTNFDVSRAVQSGTPENLATLRDIDSIAVQLQRLENAGVPVIWRPLHEANGGWFWWGAKGATAAKALYDIMYDRLTNVHGLHNLIWAWTSDAPDWYPGNDKIDIIGYDSYPGNYIYTTQKGVFDQMFDLVKGQKMIAMTENGPIPDINAMIADDAMWLYYSGWVDLVAKQNSESHIKTMSAHNRVITLDEIEYPEQTTLLGTPSRRIRLSPVRLELFDLLGRRIMVRPDKDIP